MMKTKKTHLSKASKELKANLWLQFNQEVNPPSDPIECIYSSTTTNREECEMCGSSLAFSEEGFLTCTSRACGITYKDLLDNTAEWRFYGAEDSHSADPTRCGMPINPLLQESSFGCKVMNYGSCSYELRKIKRYTEWQSMPYKEKSQYDDFQTITTMARNANIPQIIIDTAMVYHKQISDTNVSFRGANRDGVLAASIYLSCKKHGFPRDTTEIANIFHLDLTSATKGCKSAMAIINTLESNLDESERTNWCKTNSIDFVERYCSKLNINQELTKLCMFISKIVEKKNLMPANVPNAICAGIIYFVSQTCGLNVNKRDIKNVSEISEVTINKCYKLLETHQAMLIPASIVAKYTNTPNVSSSSSALSQPTAITISVSTTTHTPTTAAVN
jgi:transcription initiation factor TFIIB